MASKSETGHARTLANFQSLIAFVKGYGNTYNPSKDALKLPQLESLLSTTQTTFTNLSAQNAIYNTKVIDRLQEYSNLKPLATRLINALQVSEASDHLIEKAKSYNRKLQGVKAKSTPPANPDPNLPAPNSISTSQQSYVQQWQHFAGLIEVLKSEASYTPNETELQIASLDAKLLALATKNQEVMDAHVAASNARLARNKSMYINDDCLTEIGLEIKKYIKALFGNTSTEFDEQNHILNSHTQNTNMFLTELRKNANHAALRKKILKAFEKAIMPITSEYW